MNFKYLAISILAALSLAASAGASDRVPPHPYIEIETSEGRILLELDGREAPVTVAHVLALVDAGFYDGLIFHRVIDGFMIQGGGFTPGFKLKEDDRTIANESGNALSNRRGTIAMARTSDPHTANSQFYINVADNPQLDPNKTPGAGRWGYTVFGMVIEGMDVVDKIASAPTGPQKGQPNAPIVPIIIKSMQRYTFE
ncbi:MAG: peptidylprolyl isomerase [Pseudomonadota bacterium]